MAELRNVTLVFLVKKSAGQITEICLAMKKRGFGVNRWNGVGGKIEGAETIEAAAWREANEEIGVDIKRLDKIAEIEFYFTHNSAWDQKGHIYFVEEWEGEPVESEEMRPQWFAVDQLPFAEMWPDDPFWIPEVLQGKLIKGRFKFAPGDEILEQEVEIVAEL